MDRVGGFRWSLPTLVCTMINHASRKYLRFTHRGEVFQYQVLPFGICTAPRIFTLVMREVRVMLQK